MNRTLLIARREYVAYAKTVGFWLSLLAFPLFAVLGGGIPALIKASEPIKSVAVIEEGPNATGLAAAVRASLQADVDRQNERLREAAEKGQAGAGRAVASMTGPKMRLVDAPPAIADALGPARDETLLLRYGRAGAAPCPTLHAEPIRSRPCRRNFPVPAPSSMASGTTAIPA